MDNLKVGDHVSVHNHAVCFSLRNDILYIYSEFLKLCNETDSLSRSTFIIKSVRDKTFTPQVVLSVRKNEKEIDIIGVFQKDCIKLMSYRDYTVSIARELWKWVSKDGTRKKKDWPEWKKNGGKIENCHYNCPLCEYIIPSNDTCMKCPLEWPILNIARNDLLPCEQSFFGLWCNEKNPEIKKVYAKLISNLPCKEDTE